jgi:FtsP/CotA-like multicopper oxidase with cupredoxin domain
MRVINDSAIASFRFSVQNHKMKVIAADGVSTRPYEVDEFDILPAQRRDFVVGISSIVPDSQADFLYESWRPINSLELTGSTLL